VANLVTVFYSDGTTASFKYRLAAIARYLKRMKAIEKFRDLKSTPLFPWLLKMAFADARSSAAGRKITRIEISEKVI
jgi:hypothetical protein